LLNWNFFASLATKELAFKNSASFGTFQIIRLFSDEYMLFLLESRLGELKKTALSADQGPPVSTLLFALKKQWRNHFPTIFFSISFFVHPLASGSFPNPLADSLRSNPPPPF